MEDLRQNVNSTEPTADSQQLNIFTKSAKKRLLVSLLAIIICFCGIASATFAYFRDTASAVLGITAETFNIDYAVYRLDRTTNSESSQEDGDVNIFATDITTTVTQKNLNGYPEITVPAKTTVVFELTATNLSKGGAQGFFYLKDGATIYYSHQIVVQPQDDDGTPANVLFYNSSEDEVTLEIRCAMGTVPYEATNFLHEISSVLKSIESPENIETTDGAIKPTCLIDGTRTCAYGDCNVNYTYISKHAHDSTPTHTLRKMATCTETGTYAYYTCGWCKNPFEDRNCTILMDTIVEEALGHQMATTYTVNNSQHWFVCERGCGHTCANNHGGGDCDCPDSPSKQNHDPIYEHDETYHWKKCSVCSHTWDKAQHTFPDSHNNNVHTCSDSNCKATRPCREMTFSGLVTKILWSDAEPTALNKEFYIKNANGNVLHTSSNGAIQVELSAGTYYISVEKNLKPNTVTTYDYLDVKFVVNSDGKVYWKGYESEIDESLRCNYFLNATFDTNVPAGEKATDTYNKILIPKNFSNNDANAGIVNRDDWYVSASDSGEGYTVTAMEGSNYGENSLLFSQEALNALGNGRDFNGDRPIVLSFTYTGKAFDSAKYFPGFYAFGEGAKKTIQLVQWGNKFTFKDGTKQIGISKEPIWITAGTQTRNMKFVVTKDGFVLFVQNPTTLEYEAVASLYEYGFDLYDGIKAIGLNFACDTAINYNDWSFSNFRIDNAEHVDFRIDGLGKGTVSGKPTNVPATVKFSNYVTSNGIIGQYTGNKIGITITPDNNTAQYAYIVKNVYVDVYDVDANGNLTNKTSTYEVDYETFDSDGATREGDSYIEFLTGVGASKKAYVIRPVVQAVDVTGFKVEMSLQGKRPIDPSDFTDEEYNKLLTNNDVDNINGVLKPIQYVEFNDGATVIVRTNGLTREIPILNNSISIDKLYEGEYEVIVGNYHAFFTVEKTDSGYTAKSTPNTIGLGRGCEFNFANGTLTTSMTLQKDLIDRYITNNGASVEANLLNYGLLFIDTGDAYPHYDPNTNEMTWGPANTDKNYKLNDGAYTYLKYGEEDIVYFEAKVFSPLIHDGINKKWFEEQLKYYNQLTGENRLDLGGFVVGVVEGDVRERTQGFGTHLYYTESGFIFNFRMQFPTVAVELNDKQVVKFSDANKGLTLAVAIDKAQNKIYALLDDGDGNLVKVFEQNGGVDGNIYTYKSINEMFSNFPKDSLQSIMVSSELPEIVLKSTIVENVTTKGATTFGAGETTGTLENNGYEIISKEYLGELKIRFKHKGNYTISGLYINGSENLASKIDSTGYYVDECFTDRTMDLRIEFSQIASSDGMVVPVLISNIAGGYIWDTDESMDGKVVSVIDDDGKKISSSVIDGKSALVNMVFNTDNGYYTGDGTYKLHVDGYYDVEFSPTVNGNSYAYYTTPVRFERILFIDNISGAEPYKGTGEQSVNLRGMTLGKNASGYTFAPYAGGVNSYPKGDDIANGQYLTTSKYLDMDDTGYITFNAQFKVTPGKSSYYPEIEYKYANGTVGWTQFRVCNDNNANGLNFGILTSGNDIIPLVKNIMVETTINFTVLIEIGMRTITVYVLDENGNDMTNGGIAQNNNVIVTGFNFYSRYDQDGQGEWEITNFKINSGAQFFTEAEDSSKDVVVEFGENPTQLYKTQTITIYPKYKGVTVTGIQVDGSETPVSFITDPVTGIVTAEIFCEGFVNGQGVVNRHTIKVTTTSTQTVNLNAKVTGRKLNDDKVYGYYDFIKTSSVGKNNSDDPATTATSILVQLTNVNDTNKTHSANLGTDDKVTIPDVPVGTYKVEIIYKATSGQKDTRKDWMPTIIEVTGDETGGDDLKHIVLGYAVFDTWYNKEITINNKKYDRIDLSDLNNDGTILFHHSMDDLFFETDAAPFKNVIYAEMNIYNPYYVNPNNVFYKAGVTSTTLAKDGDTGNFVGETGGTWYQITDGVNDAYLGFGGLYDYGKWRLRFSNKTWTKGAPLNEQQLAKFSSESGLKIAVGIFNKTVYTFVDDGTGKMMPYLEPRTFDAQNNLRVKGVATNVMEAPNIKTNSERDFTQVWDKITGLKVSDGFDPAVIMPLDLRVTAQDSAGSNTNNGKTIVGATVSGGNVTVTGKYGDKIRVTFNAENGYYLSAMTIDGVTLTASELSTAHANGYFYKNISTSLKTAYAVTATFAKRGNVQIQDSRGQALANNTSVTFENAISGATKSATVNGGVVTLPPLDPGQYVVKIDGYISQTIHIDASGIPDKYIIKFPNETDNNAIGYISEFTHKTTNDYVTTAGTKYGNKFYKTSAGPAYYDSAKYDEDAGMKMIDSYKGKLIVINFTYKAYIPQGGSRFFPLIIYKIKNSAGTTHYHHVQFCHYDAGNLLKDDITYSNGGYNFPTHYSTNEHEYNLDTTVIISADHKQITYYLNGYIIDYTKKDTPIKVEMTQTITTDRCNGGTFEVLGFRPGFQGERGGRWCFDNFVMRWVDPSRINTVYVAPGFGAEIPSVFNNKDGHSTPRLITYPNGGRSGLSNFDSTPDNGFYTVVGNPDDKYKTNVDINPNTGSVRAGDGALWGRYCFVSTASKSGSTDTNAELIFVVVKDVNSRYPNDYYQNAQNLSNANGEDVNHGVILLDDVNKTTSDDMFYEHSVRSFEGGISTFAHKKDELVLFAGDAFMDNRGYFKDFYDNSEKRFGGKNAYLAGIAGSQASHWKMWAYKLLYPFNPKAIVMNIGTHDIFDAGKSADVVTARLKDLFGSIHVNLPNTQVYWYTITARIGQDAGKVTKVNTEMLKWASDKPWFTVMDLYGALSNVDGSPNKSYYRIETAGALDKTDNTSPHGTIDSTYLSAKGYDIMYDLLVNAGLSVTENIAQLDYYTDSKPNTIAGGNYYSPQNFRYLHNMETGGTIDNINLNENYNTWMKKALIGGAEGKFLFVTEFKFVSKVDGAHINFSFGDQQAQRFMLYDNNSDGKFHYASEVGVNDANKIDYYNSNDYWQYSANGTVKVAVLFDGINAYMFGVGADGNFKLQSIITNITYTNSEHSYLEHEFNDKFYVGSEKCEVYYQNTQLVKTDAGINKFINTLTYFDDKAVMQYLTNNNNSFVGVANEANRSMLNEDASVGDYSVLTNKRHRGTVFFDIPKVRARGVDIKSLFVINSTDSAFTLSDVGHKFTRDHVLVYNGSKMIQGDYVLTFDISRKSQALTALENGFITINVSPFGMTRPWRDAHLFYQKNQGALGSDTPYDTFNFNTASNTYGNLYRIVEHSYGAPDYTAFDANITELKAYIVKTERTVYLAYSLEYNGRTFVYSVSYNYVPDIMRKSTVWLAVENITVELSNFKMSQNPNDVANAIELLNF